MFRRIANTTGIVRFSFRHAAWPVVVLAAACWTNARAQVLDEPVKGFQVSDHDRTTGRRKWLLSGDTAQNAAKDEVLLTGVRMVFFDDSGATNLVVVTPRSIYRDKAKEVVSSESIRVSTGNGGMSIEGVGFQFRQVDTSLIISNQVRATIRKDLAGSRNLLPGSTNAATTAAAAAALPAAGSNQVLDILSDHFVVHTNRGVFRGQVRVNDPQGTLRCEVLTIELAQPGRQIERIIAEQQVVVESGDARVNADKGVYELARDGVMRDEVTMTGHPTWVQGGREGRAEEFIFERRTRRFRALRNVQMRFPPGTLRESGFLLPGKESAPGGAPSTRGSAEVSCDEFEFLAGVPGASPGLTICRGNVVINDDRGKLRCAELTIESAKDSNRTEKIVADRQVVVEQEGDRVACERAVYLAPVEQIELTGRPVWRVGVREGSSDVLLFDFKNRVYRATGKVEMRLPPGATGSTSWLLPVTAARDNPASQPTPALPISVRLVEIVSDEFEFRSAAGPVGMDEGMYRGHVRVRDPGGMTLECRSLSGRMLPGSSRMQTAEAKDDVIIQATGPKGEQVVGRADIVVYSAEREEVEMTGRAGVDIRVREPSGDTKAIGRKIVYARVPDRAVLSGDPSITSPRGVITGENLVLENMVLDRPESKLRATGNWKIAVKQESLKGATPLSLPGAPARPASPPST